MNNKSFSYYLYKYFKEPFCVILLALAISLSIAIRILVSVLQWPVPITANEPFRLLFVELTNTLIGILLALSFYRYGSITGTDLPRLSKIIRYFSIITFVASIISLFPTLSLFLNPIV